MMEKTGSRVAMGLMCALAVCCAVMYLTADGADVAESVLASERGPAKSVYGIGGPTSVETEDVEKAGTVVTNTPDGRMRLTDYLTNVEKEIAAEAAARKRDVKAVQEQMARNFEFNKKARAKLQAAMLHKMAVNAKKAKDDLHTAMTFVQGKFADAAALQNKRNNANIGRSKKLRGVIAANKAEAKKNLHNAVATQQRSQAALASAINARIDKTNKHVAANAAQIKDNAKKAREALDNAVAMFDKKVANARTEAENGRSKLAAQLESQDKSLRQWANNKLKIVLASTAAQFRRVRAKMAADRQHADLELKGASTRMTASLNAFKALNDKRFAQTVKDIAAAKAEAEARVQKAETSFKVGLYRLRSTVNQQVQKTNKRIDQLSDTVSKNKVAQAKINTNVAAEQKRMVKLGNARYAEHLKKDAELEHLINTNKAATDKRMQAMAAHYTNELNEVRATMKKNRAHATHMLAKKSAALYSAIAKNEAEQMKTNGALAQQTRRARLDIEDALKEAKEDFSQRLGALHTTVNENDKKFEGKIDKLTGIVRADAVKNAAGRKDLKEIMAANKEELTAAVRDAIDKGTKRMAKAEGHLMKLNAKTTVALNAKISTEITKLTKRANSQIEGLRLNSAEARKMMKKELLYAVRSMADTAKHNLDAAKKFAEVVFAQVNADEAAAEKESAEDRAAIAEKIKAERENAKDQLDDAVATMHRSLLVLKHETGEAIKESNHNVDAYAQEIKKEAEEVDALMSTQMSELNGAIEAQKNAAKGQISAAAAASSAQYDEIEQTVQDELEKAAKRASDKFSKVYIDMADQRSVLDKNLASSVAEINDKLAKQAALADGRFRHTVKDIAAARAEAKEEVEQARKDFATELAVVTSSVEEMGTRLTGEVEVVSGELISHQAMQARVNAEVQHEIARIDELMDKRVSESERARGKLRQVLDENKRAAHEEVEALRTFFTEKNQAIRDKAKADHEAASHDLSTASKAMYLKMANVQRDNMYANQESARVITKFSTEQMAAIGAAKEDFTQRLNTLTNTVAANHEAVERGFEMMTGVIRSNRAAGKADRELIQQQNDAMNRDMQTAIVKAIQEGEAKAKAVAERSREALAAEKASMLVEITNTVEKYADMAFQTIQGNHQQIADNYLSLKAYAITSSEKVVSYVGSGKGKNLSSLGDLLVNVAALSHVKAQKSEGVSPSSGMPNIFTSNNIKVDNSVSKINGLVKEYVQVCNGVRNRWPMGLGKYLLLKLEGSMTKKGVLQVDKISEKSGNWVFMNGHAVGLSNKLNDFEGLAVRMGHYEATLAKLTSSLSGKVAKKAAEVYVKPPEYPGD